MVFQIAPSQRAIFVATREGRRQDAKIQSLSNWIAMAVLVPPVQRRSSKPKDDEETIEAAPRRSKRS